MPKRIDGKAKKMWRSFSQLINYQLTIDRKKSKALWTNCALWYPVRYKM